MVLSTRDQIAQLPPPLRQFLASLTREHRLLVGLRTLLYDGDWQPMIDDLNNRLAGKPYVFRLAARIQDDLRRIEQMTQIELQYQVNLCDLVEPAAAATDPPTEARA